ncbi:hypothetical protein ADUPG1_012345 [Aduncisulcus paluster]|uniref:Uncharacterized protein n=1 Tax=Aduncisulcus paluster TaxID=2918883 RepID=A0ABQ5K1B8_9EUKA|nr:hypothetical protein ADUPG1_012345 [Aduncisulcus paluster]
MCVLNNRISRTTGYTPYKLVHGTDLETSGRSLAMEEGEGCMVKYFEELRNEFERVTKKVSAIMEEKEKMADSEPSKTFAVGEQVLIAYPNMKKPSSYVRDSKDLSLLLR